MPRLLAMYGCMVAACYLSGAIAASQAPATSSAPASDQPVADSPARWYVITINDVPVGWSRTQTQSMDGGYKTESQTRLRMAREKQIIGMSTTAWVHEDHQGHLVRAGQSQTGGGMSVRMHWEKLENGVRERRTQGAGMQERLLPAIDKQALGPVAALRAAQAARAAGKSDFTLLQFDPAQGLQASLNRWQKIEEASVVVAGQSLPCTRWKTSGPLIASGSEEWLNASGEIVLSQTPTGLGMLQNKLCDEATALAAVNEAKPPVEVMVASFVKVDPPLNDVQGQRAMTFLVNAKKPPIMPPPQEGAQRVARNSDGSFRVTIDLDKPAEPSLTSVAQDAAFMESSPMIDWKDPAVMALKESVLAKWKLNEQAFTDANTQGDEVGKTLRKARAFRSAVANHITTKNLGSAFGSASETARAKSGDCTENAVLLAALLRADGIPSRVAAGLVWAEYFAGEKNVFAWHLWTQALIDGRWVDLDATLAADAQPFHVGHVLLAVTPLTDAASDPAWSSLLTSMGNLSIEVIGEQNQ